MILLTKLFLAHLLGDFFLQPASWVKSKEEKKLKSPKLYLHILVHLSLLFLIVWDFSQWPLILSIGVLHGIIDGIKLSFQKSKKGKRRWFFVDQALHIITILGTYYFFTNSSFNIETYFTESSLIFITCLLFLTQPAALILKVIFSKWNIEELTNTGDSLKDAGYYIGILERLMVFTFIVSGHWEAVGFLIAAKSVFRFGDLKESKHRKLTEYILIGTLISFGIAILTGIVFISLV